MKIKQIAEILNARVLCCDERLDGAVNSACGSDMMSDVLAFVKDQGMLLTGLNNPQVIRTAEMMDMLCVCFVRGKKPDNAVVALAKEKGIVVLATSERLYDACGKLYSAGLK